MNRVFPRLQRGAALERLADLRPIAAGGVAAMAKQVTYGHPKAAPVPTGGTPVTSSDLAALRRTVMEEAGDLSGPVALAEQNGYDARLGRALWRELKIIRSDAAHDEVWSFLTLCVFPDILLARWPKMTDERALGTRRNALRRTWIREEVLGDALHGKGMHYLREDEIVQLTERTALARIAGLPAKMAEHILPQTPGSRREEFSRTFARLVTRRTGPLLLDVLSDSAQRSIVDDAAREAGRLLDFAVAQPSWSG